MNIIQTLTNRLFSFSQGKEAFVYIDENISGVDDMLREFGMENVFRFSDGTPDEVINKEIIKRHKDYHYTNKNKKPVIFVTKNTAHFKNISGRNYILVNITSGERRNESIANFISQIIYNKNIYDLIDKDGVVTFDIDNPMRLVKSNKIWNNAMHDFNKVWVKRLMSRKSKNK